MKNEKVYSIKDRRSIMALRQSNQTLLVGKKSNIIDSDESCLEDKRGHRYMRKIGLETAVNSPYYIYFML